MNTANLQMEGLLLALAALCGELKRKGALSGEELETVFRTAERGATARLSELRDANTEAIYFPIRFLRQSMQSEDRSLDYRTIAAQVGRLPPASPSGE